MTDTSLRPAYSFTDLPKEVQIEQLTRFKGVCALYGYEAFLRLQNAHVVVIGNGGVGSWAAESLCRTGVGAITLIDFDNIELSNSNRQLHTLSSTIGLSKSETLGKRLLDINPYLKLKTMPVLIQKASIPGYLAQAFDVDVERLLSLKCENLNDIPDPHKLARSKFQQCSEGGDFIVPPNTFVVEAIDDIFAKTCCVDLLHRLQVPLVTSGGAGGRIDPSRVRLGDVATARGDQLIKRLRNELRRSYNYPKGDRKYDQRFNILCTFSDEKPVRSFDRVKTDVSADELNITEGRPELPIFGASMTVTATAGLLLASVIIRWVVGAKLGYYSYHP